MLRNHENVTPEGGATLFEDRPNEQADELADRLSKQLPSMMKSAHLDMLTNATNATTTSEAAVSGASSAVVPRDATSAARPCRAASTSGVSPASIFARKRSGARRRDGGPLFFRRSRTIVRARRSGRL